MKLISPKNKFVIFGASGMVGGALHKSLIRNGYLKVYTPGRRELNLLDYKSVENWFKKFNPEIVLLAAAKVGGIYANDKFPADFILENLKIQTNVIEASWRNNVKKFLFLGSSCIYPKYSSQPIREEELLNGYLEQTNESYAIAKISGIKLCEALNKQYGFNSICLMPTNIYGPGDNYHPINSHVIASLIRRFYKAKISGENEVICWGTGSPLREFLHVNDLAEASIFTLENWDINNEFSPKKLNGDKLNFLNVGSGKDISIKRLAEYISKYMGFKGNIIWDSSKPDGTPKKLLDINRINKMGWKAKISLKDGLKSTIEEYKKIN